MAFPAAWANGLHGAVGYEPIIITLPEGTNFAATAVVSADRRYVRITCVPLFSAVTNVHTFSMADGTTTQTPGVGTGGSGYSGFGGQGQGGLMRVAVSAAAPVAAVLASSKPSFKRFDFPPRPPEAIPGAFSLWPFPVEFVPFGRIVWIR